MGNERFCDMCGKLIEKGKNYKLIKSEYVQSGYGIEVELTAEKSKVFCGWKCAALHTMHRLRSSVRREARMDGERRLGIFFTCEGKDIPIEWVEQVKLTGPDKYRVKKGFFLNLLEHEME